MTTASIIIPCYRQGQYLPEAIDSALAQASGRIQVVVVNDGSDDDTDSVARSYGERITYVSQANAGLAAARNAGLKRSTGKYVLFLDADDRLRPGAVAELLAESAPNRLLIGHYEHFDGAHIRSAPQSDIRMVGLPADAALLIGNIGAPFAFMSPAAAVRSISGFTPQFPGCEDWDMWLRLQAAGLDVRRVESIVGDYRLHPNSMTQRRGAEIGEMTACLLRRTLAGSVVSGIGQRTVGVLELRRRVVLRLRQVLLDIAYGQRQQRHFGSAVQTVVRAAAWTGVDIPVVAEFIKAAAGCPTRG